MDQWEKTVKQQSLMCPQCDSKIPSTKGKDLDRLLNNTEEIEYWGGGGGRNNKLKLLHL